MRVSLKMLTRFLMEESGATAIEYGVIAAAICLAILTAMQSVSAALSGIFAALTSGITTVSQ